MKAIYIIIGIPGSGKNTQGKMLAEKLQMPYISAGDTIKEFINKLGDENSDEKERLFALYQGGPTNPTEILLNSIDAKINTLGEHIGFVLTKHAVSPEEEEELRKYLYEKGYEEVKIFFLNISREESINRSLKRLKGGTTEKEPDYEKMVERIDRFVEALPSVKEFYRSQNLLTELDGEQKPDQVFQKILDKLNIDYEAEPEIE